MLSGKTGTNQLLVTSLLDFGVACEGEEGFQLASISEEPSAVGREWGALPLLFRAVARQHIPIAEL